LVDESEFDVFLSNAREDTTRAGWFVEAFKARGLRVFWDRTSIPVGVPFPSVLREKLAASRFVVVLWTNTSIRKEWVEVEAREGHKRGVLRPVLLDPIAPDSIPFGLQYVNFAPLHDWDGHSDHAELARLLDGIVVRVQEAGWTHESAGGFAGMTRFGPVSYRGGPEDVTPEAVGSFAEFERLFGSTARLVLAGSGGATKRPCYSAHAARAFFDSGGRKLYVSRVYSAGAGGGDDPFEGIARCVLSHDGEIGTLRAMWPGSGGNVSVETRVERVEAIAYLKEGLGEVQVRGALDGEVIEVLPPGAAGSSDPGVEIAHLRVVRVAADGRQRFVDRHLQEVPLDHGHGVHGLRLSVLVRDGERVIQRFDDLSTSPSDARFVGNYLARKRVPAPGGELHPRVLSPEMWPMVWLDWPGAQATAGAASFEAARLVAALFGVRQLAGGHDGLLVSPLDLDGSAPGAGDPGSGLAALQYDDIDLVFLPDAGAFEDRDACLEAATRLIRRAGPPLARIAVVDGPRGASIEDLLNFRDRLHPGPAALFFPWVKCSDRDAPASGESEEVLLPPSGFVAGMYAALDPHADPRVAPTLASAPRALGVSADVSERLTPMLEKERVNVLQASHERVALAGTERLLEEKPLFDELRYVRLYQHILKAVARGLSPQFLFETITSEFLDRSRSQVEGFLTELCKRGALAGDSSSNAFAVELRNESERTGQVILDLGISIPTPLGGLRIHLLQTISAESPGWRELPVRRDAEAAV
jgi:hypothetical protein